MNVVNGIRNSIVIVALREKEKENENVPRFSGDIFPASWKTVWQTGPEKIPGMGLWDFLRDWKKGLNGGWGAWKISFRFWEWLRKGWKDWEFPSLVWKSARVADDFPRWFEKCFGKPLENLSDWERVKTIGWKYWNALRGFEGNRCHQACRKAENRRWINLSDRFAYLRWFSGLKRGLK